MSQRKLNTLVNNKDIAEKSVSAEKLSGVFKDLITYYNPSSLSIPPVSSRARRYNRPAYTEDIENGVVSEEKLSTSLIQALGFIESSLGITSDTTNLNSRPRKNNTVAYNSDLVDGSVSLEKLSNSLRQRINDIAIEAPLSLTPFPTGSITLGTPVSITPVFFTTGTVSITGTGPRPSPLSIVNNTPISLTSSITTTGTFTYTLSVTDQNATVPRTSNEVSITVNAAQAISWSGTLHTRLLSQRPTNDVTEVEFELLTGNTLETATNLGSIGIFNNFYNSYQTDIRTNNVSIRKIFYRIISFRGGTLSIPLNLIQNGEYTAPGTNLGVGSVFSVTPAQSTGLIVVTFVIS